MAESVCDRAMAVVPGCVGGQILPIQRASELTLQRRLLQRLQPPEQHHRCWRKRRALASEFRQQRSRHAVGPPADLVGFMAMLRILLTAIAFGLAAAPALAEISFGEERQIALWVLRRGGQVMVEGVENPIAD